MAKLLIIGLDGATFDLIEPWAEEGRLPNITQLIREGVSGQLQSTFPPMSPIAWSSFMTGLNAGKHGIFDFTERKKSSYETVFVNASYRTAPTIWSLMSQKGRRVAVISVPITFPPEKVNGIMISGMDAPGVGGMADETTMYPPELYKELKPQFGEYPLGPNLFAYSKPGEILDAVIRTIDKKSQIALHLYQKEQWDCFAFVLGESDAIAHRLWKYLDDNSPLRTDNCYPAEIKNSLLTVYQKLDDVIGEFLRLASSDTTVIIMSDHGFGGNSNKAIHLNKWLEQENLLVFRDNGNSVSGVTHKTVNKALTMAKQYGLKLIPPKIKRKIYRLSDIPNKLESKLRFSGLDWERTAAFSEETPYFPSIWINLKGREPQGTVSKGQYEELLEKIKERLYQWRDPYTGKQVVRRVYRREDIYSGNQVEKAPDILIDWNLDDGYSYLSRVSSRNGTCRPISYIPESEVGKIKSGDHREMGIFIAKGPDIKKDKNIDNAHIMDLAPTILHLSGVEIPDETDGKVLSGLFRKGYFESNPIQYISGNKTASPEHGEYTEAELEAIRKRLQGLGYL